MEAEYGHLFLSNLQMLPLQQPQLTASFPGKGASTSAEIASLLHSSALERDKEKELSNYEQYSKNGGKWQEISDGFEGDPKWQVAYSEEGNRNAELRTSSGVSRSLVPKGRAASPIQAGSGACVGAANRTPQKSAVAKRVLEGPLPNLSHPASSSSAPVGRTPSPCRSPSPFRGLGLQLALNESYQAQVAFRASPKWRNGDSGFQELDCHGEPTTPRTPTWPLSHGTTDENVEGPRSPCYSVGAGQQQLEVDDRRDETLHQNGQLFAASAPSFANIEPIPDEGVRVFQTTHVPVNVQEWRWCVSSAETPRISSPQKDVLPHSGLVAAVAESLLNDGVGGITDGQYGGSFRLPFSRSAGQVEFCGGFETAGDCGQLVVGPDWQCLSQGSSKCEVAHRSGRLDAPMTPAVVPRTPVMNYRDTMREALNTFGAMTPRETPPQSPREPRDLKSQPGISMESPCDPNVGTSTAFTSSATDDAVAELAKEVSADLRHGAVDPSALYPDNGERRLCEEAISGDLAIEVSPPPPASVRSTPSPADSWDSTMPMEFSDIDEPPTMAIASGNERASFTDTHETPMQPPRMGKRKCVTHCFNSDGKKEMPLGLRAMVTLDMS